MEEKNIKKNYEALKKQYPLPDFEKIDKEFEVSSIENPVFLLREIRRKIYERLDFYIRTLESLLQPDPASLSAMHECKFIEDGEKEKVYSIYKQVMIIDRDAIVASLGGDKEDADFIKNAFDKWVRIKEDLKYVMEKLRASWDKESDATEELGYLG